MDPTMTFYEINRTSVGAGLPRPRPIDRPSLDVPLSRWTS